MVYKWYILPIGWFIWYLPPIKGTRNSYWLVLRIHQLCGLAVYEIPTLETTVRNSETPISQLLLQYPFWKDSANPTTRSIKIAMETDCWALSIEMWTVHCYVGWLDGTSPYEERRPFLEWHHLPQASLGVNQKLSGRNHVQYPEATKQLGWFCLVLNVYDIYIYYNYFYRQQPSR